MQTEMGHIAGLLKETPNETTPLEEDLDHVGKLIGIIVVVIAIVMIATILLVEHVSGFSAVFDVAHRRRGACGGGSAGRPAGRGDGRSVPRCPAHGEAKRDRAPSRGGRNARALDSAGRSDRQPFTFMNNAG